MKHNLFGNIKISWKFLIIFAVAIGIFVGVLARIPFLENTSFSDIAVVLDMWIILAILIIINCKTRKEAVLKTFIFFLISQPLIYLTEVIIDSIFSDINFFAHLFEYFNNYYFHGGNWFFWTLLTIPGSAIAFEIKKDNLIASLILSVATGYLAFAGSYGLLNSILKTFPNHLLNALICLFAAFSLGLLILKSKRPKILNLSLTAVLFLCGIIVFFFQNFASFPKTYSVEYADGTFFSETATLEDSPVEIEITDSGKKLVFTAENIFEPTEIQLKDSLGNTHTYLIELLQNNLFVSEL